jgi:hypothetical protein
VKNPDSMPKPEELMEHPELAALVALETTLVVALRALLATHTDLLEDTFPRTITAPGFWAERLIYLGTHLETALVRYRAAIDDKEILTPEEF